MGAMAALAAGAALVLVIGAGFLVGGVRGPGGHSSPPPPGSRALAPPRATIPVAPVEPSPLNLTVVVVRATEPGRFSADQAVDGLEPDTVIRVRAIGFDSFEKGVVEQCVLGLGQRTGCGSAFPVQFDEAGIADFQYRMRDSFTAGRCRAGRPTCLLRVGGSDSGRQGSTATVIGDRAPPARVQVEPRTGLFDGQAIDVSVANVPANSEVVVLLCAPPGSYDVSRCGAPGRAKTFRVGRDGVGKGELVVRTGPLGTDSVPCGERRTCGVVVATSEGFVIAPATPIGFSRGPGAVYDAGRLAAGLLAAFVLLGIAVILVRTTDWTKPTEAATPRLDNADLQTAADLDDLFGTDEELEARDPLPF
ncbi:MAG: hypothetical protein ACRD0Q_06960 [Acidimicrobiales bacterium]